MKQFVFFFVFFPMMIWSQSSFDKAEKLFKDEKYEQAQPIFEALLKTDATNLKIIEYLGDIAGSRKSWEEAVGYYEKLKDLQPSEANYFYKFGGATGMLALEVNKFRALGMIDDIRESFEKAIKLDPGHIDARWALVELNIQLPRIVGGSEGKAIRYSNELLKLSPIDGYMSRGRIEEYYKRYKSAEIQYKKAIAIGSSVKSYLMLADLYKNKMNEPERARLTLEDLKKKNQISK